MAQKKLSGSELSLPETTLKNGEGCVARNGPKIQEPFGLKFPSMPTVTHVKKIDQQFFGNGFHYKSKH